MPNFKGFSAPQIQQKKILMTIIEFSMIKKTFQFFHFKFNS